MLLGLLLPLIQIAAVGNATGEAGQSSEELGAAALAPPTESGALYRPPKHPQFILPSARLSTFNSADSAWPSDANAQPEALAEAGFFYLGMRDYTKCFHCDGGLCNWEEGDDPWVEHARWFPTCLFVTANKDEEFISRCRELHTELLAQAGGNLPPEDVQGQGAESFPSHLETELAQIMKSEEVKFYLSQGVSSDVLRMTLKRYMVEKGRGFGSHDEITQVLSSALSFKRKVRDTLPEASQDDQVPDDLEDLKRLLLCKVCMDKRIIVLFLPCRHFATCSLCSILLKDCPICRTPIRSKVVPILS